MEKFTIALLFAVTLLPLLGLFLMDVLLFRFFLLISFILAWPIVYIRGGKGLKEMLRDIRPFRLAHFLLMFFIGFVLGFTQTSNTMTNSSLLVNVTITVIPAISIFFGWLFCVFFNNITDLEIDKISNKDRPLVKGSIEEGTYKRVTVLLFILAIVFSLASGYKTLFFVGLFMLNYTLYSAKPLRLKRIPVLSKLVISFNSLVLLILGHSLVADFMNMPMIIPIFFLTVFTLAINFIDLKDYEGDKKEGVKTLPVIFGMKKAKRIIGSFFIISMVLSYFLIREIVELTGTQSISIVAFLSSLGLIEFYLINREEYRERPVFSIYLLSLLVALGLILFFG